VSNCMLRDKSFVALEAALSIIAHTCIVANKNLHSISNNKLQWWCLSERQCDAGGLNGQSETKAGVCYKSVGGYSGVACVHSGYHDGAFH